MKWKRRREQGILLIEMIVYLAILAILLVLIMQVWFHCVQHSRNLRRTTDDIARALRVGERWREDVRNAVAPPLIRDLGTGTSLEIPHANGRVVYLLQDGRLLRRRSEDAQWIEQLPRVKGSEMIRAEREHVTVWKWELELKPAAQNARLRPLFSFQAVPGGGQ